MATSFGPAELANYGLMIAQFVVGERQDANPSPRKIKAA